MFERLKKIFNNDEEVYPESILASNWWASKLLDPKVRYYNGSLCFAIEKENIPSKEKVAIFKSKVQKVINQNIKDNSERSFINLRISSSDVNLIKIAEEAEIYNFESHFGNGAIMYVDLDDGVSVYEIGKKTKARCIK